MHAWALVGKPDRAQALWDEMMEHQLPPNQYTLNTLIMAYANARQPDAAHKILKALPDEWNVTPDIATYASVLRAWELSNRPDEARALLEEIRTKERQEHVELLDVASYNTVLSAYAKTGRPEQAEALLTEMIDGHDCRNVRPDGKSFTQILVAYTRSKEERHRQAAGTKAEEVFDQMKTLGIVPNCVALNVALHCFAISGNPQKAQDTLHEMRQSAGAEVDIVSYNTCLNAWARLGEAARAETLFLDLFSVVDPQSHDSTRPPGNKRGRPEVLDKKRIRPDVQSFGIMLNAWAKQNSIAAAEHTEAILRHMDHTGDPQCRPDTVAYNTVLRAWLNAALACSGCVETASKCGERAETMLAEMEGQRSGRVRPDYRSYSTVIQIWRLAKNRERAQIVIDKSGYVGK